jgi:hypothetical protein
MKLPLFLLMSSGLVVLGTQLLSSPLSSNRILAIPMTQKTTCTCNLEPIQASLRIWLDPVFRSPDGNGALPPGLDAPPPEPQGPETHALNLELTLVNTSQRQQSVQVKGWSWRQGNETASADWNVQPDMSPLNQYTQIQRQLVELGERQPVIATVNLDINGQPCDLQVRVRS